MSSENEADKVTLELTREQFYLAIALLSETDEFVQGHMDIPKVEELLSAKGWYDEGELPHDLTPMRRSVLEKHRTKYFKTYDTEPHWQELDEPSFERLNQINDGEHLHREKTDDKLADMELVEEGADGLMRLHPAFGLYLDLMELMDSTRDEE